MSEVSEGSEHELTFANIGAISDDPNVQLPEVSEEIERNPTFAIKEEFSDTDEALGPFKIQFRQEQCNEIFKFIEQGLQGNKGQILCVSGSTSFGKTLCLRAVIETFKNYCDVCEIDCWANAEPE